MFLHPFLLFTKIIFKLNFFNLKFRFNKSLDFLNWCSCYLQLIIWCRHTGILLNKFRHRKWRIELVCLIHSGIIESLFHLIYKFLELSLDYLSLPLLFQIIHALNLSFMNNLHLIYSLLEFFIKSLNFIRMFYFLGFYNLLSSIYCSLYSQLNGLLNFLQLHQVICFFIIFLIYNFALYLLLILRLCKFLKLLLQY